MKMNDLIQIDSAYFLALYVVCTGRKWAVLVNRLMITQMESCLREVLGKPMIKSILISSTSKKERVGVEEYQQF
jgi:hypothetical protein